jgi:hypothetical protein
MNLDGVDVSEVQISFIFRIEVSVNILTEAVFIIFAC